jgi:hypothetical protein
MVLFLPGEWGNALKIDLDKDSELLLSNYQGDLYLGLQSSEMSYGSICIMRTIKSPFYIHLSMTS